MTIPTDDQVLRFWETNISSFQISHGTTSLYHAHFKEHGISARYPIALEGIIAKIRNVWTNHEHDITRRTGYFKYFEERYDAARARGVVQLSFSCREEITREFTTGTRCGGEWVREVREFLSAASKKKEVLASDEWETLLEAEALIQVIESVPPMIVKISAGCPDLRPLFVHTLLLPLEEFRAYVKRNCIQDMGYTLLPELEHQKEVLKANYEIPLAVPVAAKYLEFEFVKPSDYEEEPILDYPKLEFDQTSTISFEEIAKLRIESSGLSQIEEYQDSKFEYSYKGDSYIVTRKALTEKDAERLALVRKNKELKNQWKKIFGL